MIRFFLLDVRRLLPSSTGIGASIFSLFLVHLDGCKWIIVSFFLFFEKNSWKIREVSRGESSEMIENKEEFFKNSGEFNRYSEKCYFRSFFIL